MPNKRIADLLAERLCQLVWPGSATKPAQAIPLPMFQRQSLPPEMAEHFAKEAGFPDSDVSRLVAEAIVHLIETDDEIVLKSDLKRMRDEAVIGLERQRQIKITCRLCGNPLINKMNVDTRNPSVDGVKFLTALQSMTVECPHVRK